MGTAIRKIGEALGDTADNPRFIETLPRRGFRFIAPVNGYAGTTVAEPVMPKVAPEPSTGRRPSRRGGVLLTGVLLGIGALAFLLRPALPSPRVLRVIQITSDGRQKFPNMFTGGGRLYFTERIRGRYVPVALSNAGGEAAPIPTPFQDAEVLDSSRDGSELLTKEFSTDEQDKPIWAVSSFGGPSRRLGGLEGVEATWSPDGQEVLYTKGRDSHLYLAKSDGTGSRALAKVPGSPYSVHWSPDGRRISVSVADKNSNVLWEVSTGGTNLHPVLAGWDFLLSCNGRWTFDGKYLLFDSFQGGPDNIWSIPEKAGFFYKGRQRPRQLTTGPLDVGAPVPSEDGKRIFVISGKEHAQLNRYDSKSKTWKPFLSGISAEHVDFSSDRQWVAYISYPDANLFSSNIDGSQVLQLTVPPVQAAMPRISPDGKTIAYMAKTPGKRWRIWLTPFSGGSSRQLTSGDVEEREPTWSPDGRFLAFCGAKPPSRSNTIELFDMRTGRISALPPLASPFYPRWSPDGHYIAATDGFQKIVRFDLKTRNWEVLVRHPDSHLYEPSWSHDGQSIYFVDYSENTEGYYRFRIRDHKIEKIIGSEMDAACVRGIAGGWHALTPDESLLSLLNQETPEIYALEWNAP